MDSVDITDAGEQVHSSSNFTHKNKPKKLGGIVKLGGSEKNRYRALRQLKIPSTEAVELSKKTFAELREMGYKLGSLLCKPGGKPVKRTGKKPKEIRNVRSRYEALKKIGVTSNLKELSRKSFAELKQMGFKFSSPKPVKMPVNQSLKLPKGNAAERPKANDNPVQHPPKQTHTEIVPTQHQPQTYSEDLIRVGIEDAKPMTDAQLETLSHTILENIAGMPRGEGPRFNGYSRKPGWLLITCVDQRSKNWLEELIPSLKPWPGASLKVIPESKLRKPNIAVVFIPNIDITMIEQSLSLIRAQNSLRTELWKVVHSKPQNRGVILTLSLDDMSVEELQKKDMKANLGFGGVQFRLKGIKARQSGTDFPASNSTRSLPDQSLPGVSSSDPSLEPAPNVPPQQAIPCHPIANLSETSEVCEVPLTESFSNRATGHREPHQRYSSTGSYRSRQDTRGGSSHSGREDINGHIEGDTSYSCRGDMKEDDSNCIEEDIRGDFPGSASGSRVEDMRGDISEGSSYRGKEIIRGGIDECSVYSGREDTREEIDRGYNSREDIKGGVSYYGDRNVSRGFGGTSYNGSENNNRGASISGRKDITVDNQRDSSYNERGDIVNSASYTNYCGREDNRDNFYGGSRVTGRADILGDSSYGGRDDIEMRYDCRISEDIHRGPSYSGREDIDGESSYSGKEYVNRDVSFSCRDENRKGNYRNRDDTKADVNQDVSYRGREGIRGDICYSDTDNIRGNHNQQISKSDFNDDISSFKSGRYSGEDGTQFPSGPVFSRVRDLDIRRFSGGTTGLGGKDDRQIEIDRNRDIGEFSEGHGFGGKPSHDILSPSTASYMDKNFGGHKRAIHGCTTGFGGSKGSRIHQQFPPGSRGDRQISSNWGNSDINSMGRGYTKGGQWYSAGSIQGQTRGDTQRYTRGHNRGYAPEVPRRYTRDDQGDAKEVNQYDTRKDW